MGRVRYDNQHTGLRTNDKHFPELLDAIRPYLSDNLTLENEVKSINSNSPITIQGTNTTYSGLQTLTGNFTFTTGGNSCGTKSVVKNIWVGKPAPASQTVNGSPYYSGFQICPGSNWVGVSWNGQVNTTSWQVWTGGSYCTTNTSADFTLATNGPSSVSISVNATNVCGTSYNASWYLSKKTYGCGSYLLATYPNPSTNEVNVHAAFVDNEMNETEVVPDQLILIDRYNRKIVNESPKESAFRIDTRNIPDGEYYLKVVFGTEEVTRRILIKK